MKRSDLIFALLLVPLDFLMIIAAGCVAYFLRFQSLVSFRPVIYEIPFQHYLFWVTLVAFFFLVVFAFSGLYAIGYRKISNELQRVFTACSAGVMLVIVFIFFIQELFTSRFIVLAAWLFSIAFVVIGRLALRGVRAALFYRGIGLHPIILIGPNQRAMSFIDTIAAHPSWGYRIAGRAETFSDDDQKNLVRIIAEEGVSELFVLDPSYSRERLEAIVDFAVVQHISVRYAADLIGAKRLVISMLAGIPLVLIKRTRLEGWGRIFKRLFDIMLSGTLLVLILPLFAAIAIAIKLDSPGPVLYRNIRVGPRGLFTTYKFRRMKIELCTGPGYDQTGEAERVQERLIQERSVRKGPLFKVLGDPRSTRVGHMLEKTSLDELPQLFNVLLGNMSLVGPRPHMPNEVAGYTKDHHKLFSVKPGITGLAQISGRSDLDFDDEARLDIFYAENWSLALDMIIILKTPLAILTRKSRV
ncbi:sugar transferase [Candidatus Uhrbacteria bacterium]|nr:sugar transferase [Candidatus Uhrbacteria bacterium]